MVGMKTVEASCFLPTVTAVTVSSSLQKGTEVKSKKGHTVCEKYQGQNKRGF